MFQALRAGGEHGEDLGLRAARPPFRPRLGRGGWGGAARVPLAPAGNRLVVASRLRFAGRRVGSLPRLIRSGWLLAAFERRP